jgi:hypothetical protein
VTAHAATRKIACAAFAIAALSAAAGVGLTTPAAATSAAPAAPAGTAGFPAPGLPFAIQETLGGRTLCLTRPATVKFAEDLKFRSCSLLDLSPEQQWYRNSADANGYGQVTDSSNDCIVSNGFVRAAVLCPKTKPEILWKQLSNGMVVNEYFKPSYWFVGGIKTSGPFLGGTINRSIADPFSLLVLDLVP